jgi:hypothetical protein
MPAQSILEAQTQTSTVHHKANMRLKGNTPHNQVTDLLKGTNNIHHSKCNMALRKGATHHRECIMDRHRIVAEAVLGIVVQESWQRWLAAAA